jgi:(p)ppGpp synthase/HD superfamily hydrolase
MNLEKAIQIAVEAHAGVCDKGGNPYILHPLRVMMSLHSEEERIVGVLHDVVEDTEWTFEALSQVGFSAVVIEALKSVTKSDESENYDLFVRRAMANPIGRKVKIADINDNLDVRRIRELTQKDLDRLNKYKRALASLTGQSR